MWILALETATAHGSLALLRDDAVMEEAGLDSGQYASHLFVRAAELLAHAGLTLRDVNLFAAADGPGSFTGIRAGLTAVKGWHEVLGTPIAAVSTLRAIAGLDDAPGMAVLDALRGEIFTGIYPPGDERLETQVEFRARLAAWQGAAHTPDAALQSAFPALALTRPLLAGTVGRLGLRAFQAGHITDALHLDARYLRRAGAELSHQP